MGRGAADPGSAVVRQQSATDLESVMDNLEDAVALFSPRGEVIFSNAAMNALHAAARSTRCRRDTRPPDRRTHAGGAEIAGPGVAVVAAEEAANRTDDADAPEPADRLVISHAITDASGRFLGAMLVARNLAY